MLANVLNSDEAVEASVQVARAFVRLRRLLTSTPELARKLDALEKKYDVQFKDKKECAFGVAVFDNAQVRHAYSPGVLKMKFE